MRSRYLIDGQTHEVAVTRGAHGTLQIERQGRSISVRSEPLPDGRQRITIDGQAHDVWVGQGPAGLFLHSPATGALDIETVTAAIGQAHGSAVNVITAPMPGTVVAIAVTEGQLVAAGQPLMVIESMKLETTLSASREARVKTLHCAVGNTFALKAKLVTLEDADATPPTAPAP